MRRLRHLGFLLWLGLALAMGQHAAALHDLSHATERLSQKQDSKPAPLKCDQCFACAELSGAASAKAVAAPFIAAASPRPPSPCGRSVSVAALLAFLSRAPPTLL
jgi:hypothetical protein